MVPIAGTQVQEMVAPAVVGFMLHHGRARGSAGVQAIRPLLRMRAPQGWQDLPQAAYLRGLGFDWRSPGAGARHFAAAMVERRTMSGSGGRWS